MERLLVNNELNRNLKAVSMVELITDYAFHRAIAQAVRYRLPAAAARVRSQTICGGKIGTGACFLRVLRFPLRILFSLNAPQSPSSIIRGWYNRPTNGRHTLWTQSRSHPTKIKKQGIYLEGQKRSVRIIRIQAEISTGASAYKATFDMIEINEIK
jgi:hypothetical protein